jgi:shikimate dehydrogenase
MYENLSGATRITFIVGAGVEDLKSPGMLSKIFYERNLDAVMLAADVPANSFNRFFQGVTAMRNLAGLMITMPHKFAAYSECADVTDRARFLKAVNVMRRSDSGRWFGDNFDGVGFIAVLRKKSSDIAGSRGLLFGAGGAGTAIALELLDAGLKSLAVVDSDGLRCDGLVRKLSELHPGRVVRGDSHPSGFQYVVNATPLGMQPGDALPFDISAVDAGAVVGDVVTSSPITNLIQKANARGCVTVTGTEMLKSQAELHADFIFKTAMPN